MKNTKLIFMFLVACIAIAGCAKDGDTGPQGPQGAPGQNGNANVKSQTFTVVSADWVYTAPSYGVDIVDNDITQAIVDDGIVMVFMSNGSGGWTALPFTVYPSNLYGSTFVPVHYLNGVTIWKTDSDLTQPVNPGTQTFKVIAVKAQFKLANPHINWLDYEQVQKVID